MNEAVQEYKYIEMIYEYMNLDKKIIRKQKRINSLEKGFYSRNFCGHTDFDDPKGIRSKGFNVQNEVCQYVDRLEEQYVGLSILKRKKQYFQNFMNGLSKDIRGGVERDFKHDNMTMYNITLTNTHKKVVQEILEIEEAICHEFQKDPFPEYDKELLELETVELSSKTIENSFQIMLSILGVK